MPKSNTHTGFAIAIAWPETYCKQPGGWYDGLMRKLGISKHHYYKVGHAAVVLIDDQNKACHYFDFGRYLAPFQHGRVRSQVTDHLLKMKTTAVISKDGIELLNFKEILHELQLFEDSHGEGALHASYTAINFKKSYSKALSLQEQSPIPYGPFKFRGNNCSRFVNDCIVAGQPHSLATLKLRFAVTLTPTPLDNIRALKAYTIIAKQLNTEAFVPQPISDKSLLEQTLLEPTRPTSLPTEALWMSGEGAGSWFHIQAIKKAYQITRYSPEANIECQSLFATRNEKIKLQSPYTIDYLSHCHSVSILQNDKKIILHRI